MAVYIIDTETTGITDPEPIQVAWIRLDSLGLEVGRFESLYCPSKPISFGAMATHHILDSDLRDSEPSSSFRLPEDCHFLIGHNIDFDWQVLGKPDVKRICTLALSRALYPHLDSHSLGALSYFLSFPDFCGEMRERLKGAHDALSDALLTLGLLRNIIFASGISYPLDFNELWEKSEEARIPTVMPFGKHKGVPLKEVPSDYKRWLRGQPDVDPYLLKALEAS